MEEGEEEGEKQKVESRKLKWRRERKESGKLKVECLVSFSELGKSSEAHLAWTERSEVKTVMEKR